MCFIFHFHSPSFLLYHFSDPIALKYLLNHFVKPLFSLPIYPLNCYMEEDLSFTTIDKEEMMLEDLKLKKRLSFNFLCPKY